MLPSAAPTPPSETRRVIQDVVLVEDNPVDQHLISTCFHRHFIPSRWRQFSDGRGALDACLADPPQLMLLDLQLPGLNGLDVLKVLRQDGHKYPVLVLTSYPGEAIPQSLLQLNAHGYLDKFSLTVNLAAAINSVLDGRLFFSASRSPFPETHTVARTPVLTVLSERETEIARLVTHGFPSKQIANRLNLSVRTVENHRARIMMRLGLVNTADLVRWCVQQGLG